MPTCWTPSPKGVILIKPASSAAISASSIVIGILPCLLLRSPVGTTNLLNLFPWCHSCASIAFKSPPSSIKPPLSDKNSRSDWGSLTLAASFIAALSDSSVSCLSLSNLFTLSRDRFTSLESCELGFSANSLSTKDFLPANWKSSFGWCCEVPAPRSLTLSAKYCVTVWSPIIRAGPMSSSTPSAFLENSIFVFGTLIPSILLQIRLSRLLISE